MKALKELIFASSKVLSGNDLSVLLEKGKLLPSLPDGTEKSFEGIPPAPKDAAVAQEAVCLPEGTGMNNLNGSPGAYFLSAYTFENDNDNPRGPQIRIPIEQVVEGLAAGSDPISWCSDEAIEWDRRGDRVGRQSRYLQVSDLLLALACPTGSQIKLKRPAVLIVESFSMPFERYFQ